MSQNHQTPDSASKALLAKYPNYLIADVPENGPVINPREVEFHWGRHGFSIPYCTSCRRKIEIVKLGKFSNESTASCMWETYQKSHAWIEAKLLVHRNSSSPDGSYVIVFQTKSQKKYDFGLAQELNKGENGTEIICYMCDPCQKIAPAEFLQADFTRLLTEGLSWSEQGCHRTSIPMYFFEGIPLKANKYDQSVSNAKFKLINKYVNKKDILDATDTIRVMKICDDPEELVVFDCKNNPPLKKDKKQQCSNCNKARSRV